MNPSMHELLLTLDRAKLQGGDGWVSSNALRHIPINTRTYAQTRGYVTGRGNTAKRQYMITSAGRTMLAKNADANMEMMPEIENGYVPTGEELPPPEFDPEITAAIKRGENPQVEFKGIDSLISVRPKPLAIVQAVPTEQKNRAIPAPLIADPRTCACVQAIDILSEDWPEVTDLVDALMKLNQRKAADRE